MTFSALVPNPPIAQDARVTLSGIAQAIGRKGGGNALASGARNGATSYFTTAIATLGARAVTVVVSLTSVSAQTIRPAIEVTIGGTAFTLAPGPGRATTGTAWTTFGLVSPDVASVDAVTHPVCLPDSIRVGYTASGTLGETTQVDYVLSF